MLNGTFQFLDLMKEMHQQGMHHTHINNTSKNAIVGIIAIVIMVVDMVAMFIIGVMIVATKMLV